MNKKIILVAVCASSLLQGQETKFEVGPKFFLARIENHTDDGHYQYFGEDEAGTGAFLVTPSSTKEGLVFTGIVEGRMIPLMQIKGSFPSIFLKIGIGEADGMCEKKGVLPRFLEIWTENPSAFASQKDYYRMCLTENDGFFGLRIHPDGSPEPFAIDGMSFITQKNLEDTEDQDQTDTD